jgi:hypothetical protein
MWLRLEHGVFGEEKWLESAIGLALPNNAH